MESYVTLPDVTRFEAGLPDGSLLIVEGTYKTKDPQEIAVLDAAVHAVQKAPAKGEK